MVHLFTKYLGTFQQTLTRYAIDHGPNWIKLLHTHPCWSHGPESGFLLHMILSPDWPHWASDLRTANQLKMWLGKKTYAEMTAMESDLSKFTQQESGKGRIRTQCYVMISFCHLRRPAGDRFSQTYPQPRGLRRSSSVPFPQPTVCQMTRSF